MHTLKPQTMTIRQVVTLQQQLAACQGEMEVDLSGVEEIDTTGLQWMLMAKRRPDLQVHFVGHSAAVVRLIELANLGQALGDPIILAAPRQGDA